jgi:hypothetical protein
MFRLALGCFVAVLFLAAAQPAEAGFLINPSGGTILFNSASDHDDQVVAGRNLGFSAQFFSNSITTVGVSTNGNLNFASNSAFGNTPFPTTNSINIAPLWDDLYIYQGTGQTISEKLNPGISYTTTWDVSGFSNSAAVFKFQATIFGASDTIGTFQFLANDIVFSYDTISGGFENGEATVGLNQGDGNQFASLPGDGDGFINNSQANLLPTAPGFAILFRPVFNDGPVTYNVSVIDTGSAIATPEPASMITFVVGAIGFFGIARRRKLSQTTA